MNTLEMLMYANVSRLEIEHAMHARCAMTYTIVRIGFGECCMILFLSYE